MQRVVRKQNDEALSVSDMQWVIWRKLQTWTISYDLFRFPPITEQWLQIGIEIYIREWKCRMWWVQGWKPQVNTCHCCQLISIQSGHRFSPMWGDNAMRWPIVVSPLCNTAEKPCVPAHYCENSYRLRVRPRKYSHIVSSMCGFVLNWYKCVRTGPRTISQTISNVWMYSISVQICGNTSTHIQ